VAGEAALVDSVDSVPVAARRFDDTNIRCTRTAKERVVPALQSFLFPWRAFLMPMRATPVLLEPFARPCSVNVRTLSG